MKTIRVSDSTYRAIAEAATLPFRSTGTRQPDGTWLVPVGDDSWQRIRAHQLPGESDDDTIMRLIRFSRDQKPS